MAYKTSADRKGFTLVELLIAVAFFSFILLFISAGFVALNRQFVKGRTTRDVQNDARFVIEDITRTLRASEYGQLKSSDAIQMDSFMCFGPAQYTWNTLTDQQIGGGANSKVFADTGDVIRLARTDYSGGACEDTNLTTSNSVELIGSNTVVQYLDIDDYGQIPGLFRVTVVLSTPQDEIIGSSGEDANCDALVILEDASVQPEYCSVVKFETIVNIRD